MVKYTSQIEPKNSLLVNKSSRTTFSFDDVTQVDAPVKDSNEPLESIGKLHNSEPLQVLLNEVNLKWLGPLAF